MKPLRPKPVLAFACVHQADRTINPYWVRAQAKDCRGTDWKRLRKAGWRVIKVKVVAA